MAAFDDWVTDPAITLANARAFADDPGRIGRPLQAEHHLRHHRHARHLLQDARATAVTGAMMARMLTGWLTVRDVAKIAAGGGRTALVIPEGGHFASTVAAAGPPPSACTSRWRSWSRRSTPSARRCWPRTPAWARCWRVSPKPDGCPCGDPGPAVRVTGRAADLLTFPGADGAPVTLAPLPPAPLLETVPGLELFQIVQAGPRRCACDCTRLPAPTPTPCGTRSTPG